MTQNDWAYYYYSICGQAKLSVFFFITSLLIYCFIWAVACDGLAGHLSVCLSPFLLPSLSLIPHSKFVSCLPHDQPSVYSVLYTAVPRTTGIANSFRRWRQCDRVRTQGTGEEGERENENFGPVPFSIPFQSQAQQDTVPPFHLTTGAINRITGLAKHPAELHKENSTHTLWLAESYTRNIQNA